MKTNALLLTVLPLLTAMLCVAQPGSLDTTFGTNGKVQHMSVGGSAVAIQANGKILVTGNYNGFSVERFTKSGRIDKGFGDNGIASTTFEEFGYGLHASLVAIAPDRKIIVAGSVWNGDFFETHLCMARFNIDGSLDSSFGTEGRVQAVIGQNANEDVSDLIIQPDGKIIITIWQYMNFNQGRIAAIRFDADGVEDAGFYIDFSAHDLCYALSLQSDGKIVVTGSTASDASGEVFALFRFNQNGWLDQNFGKSGLVKLKRYGKGIALATKQDDKILALTNDSVLLQFLKDGLADTSFGKKGKVSIPFKVNAVALQADGKILLAGSRNNGINNDFALTRYKTNGKLDKTFGVDGVATSDFGSSEEGSDLSIQPDGKIVVSGSGHMARYNGDAALFGESRDTERSGITSQPLAGDANLYPNPVQSVLHIAFKNAVTAKILITIYNASGKPVISKYVQGDTRLDLKPLAAGMYLIKITDENGKELYSGKVIKQ